MRIVVFGDIHGNKYPLEYLLKNEKADIFVCLGDIVGYGPYNNECLDLVLKKDNISIVRGNHEDMFIKGQVDNNCSQLAKDFFQKSYSFFNKSYVEELNKIPSMIQLDNTTFCHTLLNKHIYEDTILDPLLKGNFFIGHSHTQFLRTNPSGFICNPGSLGQNRNPLKKQIAEYAIYNTEDSSIEFKNFDNKLIDFIEVLRTHNYSSDLIEYYKNKDKQS